MHLDGQPIFAFNTCAMPVVDTLPHFFTDTVDTYGYSAVAVFDLERGLTAFTGFVV